jgi:hypothetical protein
MNTPTKTTTLLKTGMISFCSLILIVFASFKKEDLRIKDSKAETKLPLESDPELLGVFTMDYANFLSLGAAWDRRLILQFVTTTKGSDIKYDVAAFLATSQEDHAVDENPIMLTSTTTQGLTFTDGKAYYLGNNYIRMRSIKRYIASVTDDNSGKTIQYLKFTAVSMTDEEKKLNLVRFIIQAYSGSNELLKTDEIGYYEDSNRIENGGVLSNPSPPADPSTD